MNEKTEKFVAYLQTALTNAQGRISEFKALLEKDHHGAAQRSGALIDAAATVDIYEDVLKALTSPDSKATFESIREYATERVVLSARNWPSSPYERKIAETWAFLVDTMKLRF